jgi:hypothetical protein
MFSLGINAAKSNFFDRSKIAAALDRATQKNLSRYGAFVRTRAKTSIRKRKGTSPPGGPPFSHVGLLRKFIFFSYDPFFKSVIVGPTLLRAGSKAPGVLEHGGDETLTDRRGRTHRATYQARPFMGPAAAEENKRLPEIWADSVR